MANLASRVHEFTLEQLRAAGADEERFPTAETLVKASANAAGAAGGRVREVAAQPPVLFSSAALAARMQARARLLTCNAVRSGGSAVAAVSSHGLAAAQEHWGFPYR